MSAFHRIEDPRSLPAQRYIDLAVRLVAYRGVMRARVEAEQEETVNRSTPTRNVAYAPAQGRDDRTVESTPLAMQVDAVLSSVVEYSEAG